MNSEKYSYKQWFPWWIIALMLLLTSPIFIAFTQPDFDTVGKVVSFVSFLLVLLVCAVHLSVNMDSDKISFRLFPFHFKDVNYLKANIIQIKLVKYVPLKDFGGWGIRYNSKGEKAFTVWGNYVMKLQMHDKVRYIGIKNVASAHRFLSMHYADKYVVDESIKGLMN